MKFVRFTTPDGHEVKVNPNLVADVEDNDGGEYDSRAKAVIMLVQGFQAVRETKAEVLKALERDDA